MMTKDEVKNTIEIVATANGFKTSEYMTMYSLPEIKSENLNFCVKAETTVDLEKRCVRNKHLTFRASISRMGGETTTDELFAIAREIEKAAVVVETLNLMDMSYEEYFGEQ